MAIKYVSDMLATTELSDTDVLLIDTGQNNRKITWAALKVLLGTVSNVTVDNTAGTITITTANGQSYTVTPHDPSKVDVVTGKGLSTNDYTTAEKEKLAGIAAGAEVNVNADWSASSGDAEILNKPTTLAGYGIQASDVLLTAKVDKTTTVNGHALSGNVTVSKADVGLGNVDNTADTDKPISTAMQIALSEIYEALTKYVCVNSAQTFTEQEKYIARQNIGAISSNEVEHKRFGVSGVGQSSPTLTRLYDAEGMMATPSTDSVAGYSDFDNFAPFNRRKCVGNWTAGTNKAVFNVQAYEGDADYAEDGSMGDYVAVEVEPFYYYDKDGVMAVSTYPWPGYEIHPVCKDYDGNVRAKTYIPVYALAQDANGKAVSLPGFQNQRGGYNDLRNYAATYNATGMSQLAMIEPSAVWHYEWLLMTIEFATTNIQTIMYGAASMRYNNGDTITAVPGANKVVMGAAGSNFVIGQTILLYASYDQSVNVNLYNRITNVQKCDASGNVDSSGSYYLITYDGTNRSPSVGWYICSRPWCTGATAGYAPGVNAVKGHTGSPVSNTTGKYAMRYRWRENVYGNQNMTTLDLADLRVADGDSFHLDWYFLADPRKYVPYGNYGKADIQNTAKGWVKLGVSTPVASYVNGYVKELGFDSAYPWVKVPILTTGGSASTFFSDYANLVHSYEVRAVRRGGHVVNGAYAGPCFFSASLAPSNANWYFGATLYMLQ